MIAKLLSLLAQILWIKQLGLLTGIALILSIYVHEYGHYLMADKLNLKPKHPRFIPFLGAYVKFNETFNNKALFKVAISGPLIGGALGVLSFYIAFIFNSDFFHQVALFSIVFNLINLIPFPILDGGHIVKTLEFKKFQLFITIIIILITLVVRKYYMIILVVLGILNLIYSYSIKEKLIPMNKDEKKIGMIIYISLILILGVHTYFLLKQ